MTWDRLLEHGVITPGNWDACPALVPNFKHNSIAGGTIDRFTTTIPMLESLDLCFNLDKFNYAATPQDVVSRRGEPAAPIVNMDFTRIP